MASAESGGWLSPWWGPARGQKSHEVDEISLAKISRHFHTEAGQKVKDLNETI